MDFYKDLLKKEKKSRWLIGLGVSSVLLSILLVLNKIYHQDVIWAFDWLYSVYFLLYGIISIIEGSGKSTKKIFGNAYIQINTGYLKFKPDIFKNELCLHWKDIKSIKFTLSHIEIENIENSFIRIKYNQYNYTLVQKIKNSIISTAKEKNILIHPSN